MQRRAEKEFQENLRNELYYQEGEEAAIAKQRAEAEKRDRVRMELQEAKNFQMRLNKIKTKQCKYFIIKLLNRLSQTILLNKMLKPKSENDPPTHKASPCVFCNREVQMGRSPLFIAFFEIK